MNRADQGKSLLILGCSDRKIAHGGQAQLPAFEMYDGPYYRVIRKFLREYRWPDSLAVSVLSAEHRLFGALKDIAFYDRRMTRDTASAMSDAAALALDRWTDAGSYACVYTAVGKDYMPALQLGLDLARNRGLRVESIPGGIGMKQKAIKDVLLGQGADSRKKRKVELKPLGRPRYFLPDWDDLIDPDFDFKLDRFSDPVKRNRNDQHCNRLMRSTPMCDGILVSLAQRRTSKGALRRLDGSEPGSLRPTDLRDHFGLNGAQLLFGDCGAFSYAAEDYPTLSIRQAVALYELYDFDFGTSVDHIPIKALPESERQRRVKMTCDNAEEFIELWRSRGRLFTPVGAVQGTSASEYAANVKMYYMIGYRHMAIGGLVPLSDAAILEIVRDCVDAANSLPQRPWLHLFGVYRPNLQAEFAALGVDSFDSATYFRKAWLRSDRNYIGANGQWYTALRVPMTDDPRTRKRLEQSGADIEEMRRKEGYALKTLDAYGRGEAGLEDALTAVLDYDERLLRANDVKSMRDSYKRTLEDKPWQDCGCEFCQKLGIQVLIFRGGNRNRRRGAHNTAALYANIGKTK